jgi:peptidyl-tRNA hydrolase, PTH1 family
MTKDEKIKLIVGLGNPGPEYELTKHNMGFLLLDFMKDKLAPNSNWKKWKKNGEYLDINLDNGEKIFLIKPLTYMNNSGIMVRSFADFYKLKSSSILVCFDDMSIDFGRIRLRRKGSFGGQKGMASIINMFSSQDISRLKMGTGPKPDKMPAENYVLSRLRKVELDNLETTLEKAYEAVMTVLEKGVDSAMNLYNSDDNNTD